MINHSSDSARINCTGSLLGLDVAYGANIVIVLRWRTLGRCGIGISRYGIARKLLVRSAGRYHMHSVEYEISLRLSLRLPKPVRALQLFIQFIDIQCIFYIAFALPVCTCTCTLSAPAPRRINLIIVNVRRWTHKVDEGTREWSFPHTNTHTHIHATRTNTDTRRRRSTQKGSEKQKR